MNRITNTVAVYLIAVSLQPGLVQASDYAEPECFVEENSLVLTDAEISAEAIAQGYQVESIGIAAGNCFVVTAIDAYGTRTQLFFDPIYGSLVDLRTLTE